MISRRSPTRALLLALLCFLLPAEAGRAQSGPPDRLPTLEADRAIPLGPKAPAWNLEESVSGEGLPADIEPFQPERASPLRPVAPDAVLDKEFARSASPPPPAEEERGRAIPLSAEIPPVAQTGAAPPILPSAPAKEPAEPSPSEQVSQQGQETSHDMLEEALDHVKELSLEEIVRYNNWRTWLLLGLVVLAWIVGKILGLVLFRIGQGFDARGWSGWAQLVIDLGGPIKLVVLTVALTIGLYNFSPDPLPAFWRKTLLLLYSIAIFWYAFNLVSVVDSILRKLTARTESGLEQLVPLIRKTLRIFVVVIGVLFVLNNVFEQQIGAWLAGLGIAGLAISLAAQDSLKNLFGSITILLDRPFRLGERIVYGGHDGIIEEIGFRSTKLRTLTGHLVTIPNSNIVNDPVENIGLRPSIRRIMNITITYDTPLTKIQEALQILRDILEEDGIREPIHPTINGDDYPPRVYFKDYESTSLVLFVIYWYAPPAYWDYMEHAERLNLRIFEEFERAGIEFAFPTQTLYLAGDPRRQLAVDMLGKPAS